MIVSNDIFFLTFFFTHAQIGTLFDDSGLATAATAAITAAAKVKKEDAPSQQEEGGMEKGAHGVEEEVEEEVEEVEAKRKCEMFFAAVQNANPNFRRCLPKQI
jgi:hypothetical protein